LQPDLATHFLHIAIPVNFLNSSFIFDRSHRLLLGFESPIHAGIFIAILIPWIRFMAWSPKGFSGKLKLMGSLVCEITFLYLLSLTGSRGPILALLVAYAAEVALSFRFKEYSHARLLLVRNVAAVLLLVTFIMATGAGSRFAEAVTLADGSVHNRIEILKNARNLLLIDPLSGCGWGWSGHYCSQWFEPQSLHYLYHGLSNEYLQIGTELGLPALFVILTCVCTALLAPWFPHFHLCQIKCGIRGKIANGAYFSLVIFSAVAWATSWRYSPLLNILFLGAFAVSTCLTKAALNRFVIFTGMTAAGCVVAALLIIPTPVGSIRAALYGTSIVGIRETKTPVREVRTVVLVDKDVLGKVYGQTLRHMLHGAPFEGEMCVVFPFASSPIHYPDSVDACITFGASIASTVAADLPPLRLLVIAHPNVYPPEKFPASEQIRIILPAIDEAGVNGAWRSWSEAHGVPLDITANCGLDMQNCAETFFANLKTHD
jgi:hypothetical protein